MIDLPHLQQQIKGTKINECNEKIKDLLKKIIFPLQIMRLQPSFKRTQK
jgi:hypothetical protein